MIRKMWYRLERKAQNEREAQFPAVSQTHADEKPSGGTADSTTGSALPTKTVQNSVGEAEMPPDSKNAPRGRISGSLKANLPDATEKLLGKLRAQMNQIEEANNRLSARETELSAQLLEARSDCEAHQRESQAIARAQERKSREALRVSLGEQAVLRSNIAQLELQLSVSEKKLNALVHRLAIAEKQVDQLHLENQDAARREETLKKEVFWLREEANRQEGAIDLFKDIITARCWQGTDEEVCTRISAALAGSKKFASVEFHHQDAGRNYYFICQAKPQGNQKPQVYLLGFNTRRRRIWSSLHDKGRGM